MNNAQAYKEISSICLEQIKSLLEKDTGIVLISDPEIVCINLSNKQAILDRLEIIKSFGRLLDLEFKTV